MGPSAWAREAILVIHPCSSVNAIDEVQNRYQDYSLIELVQTEVWISARSQWQFLYLTVFQTYCYEHITGRFSIKRTPSPKCMPAFLTNSFPSCCISGHRRERGSASGHRPARFTHSSRVFPSPWQTANWGETGEELCSFRSGETTTAALPAPAASFLTTAPGSVCVGGWISPCYPHSYSTTTPCTTLKHCFLFCCFVSHGWSCF